MFRRKQKDTSKISLSHGDPPTATSRVIASHNGDTVALDATLERMQATKYRPTLDLKQMIDSQTVENFHLRRKLSYLHRKSDVAMYIVQEMHSAKESLEEALRMFNTMNEDIEKEEKDEFI
jgi:hypothetical protein